MKILAVTLNNFIQVRNTRLESVKILAVTLNNFIQETISPSLRHCLTFYVYSYLVLPQTLSWFPQLNNNVNICNNTIICDEFE